MPTYDRELRLVRQTDVAAARPVCPGITPLSSVITVTRRLPLSDGPYLDKPLRWGQGRCLLQTALDVSRRSGAHARCAGAGLPRDFTWAFKVRR